MFIEPIVTLIISDFVVRLSNLRNERHISQKLSNLTWFISFIAITRFAMSLPDLFVYAERSVFIHEAGMTYY